MKDRAFLPLPGENKQYDYTESSPYRSEAVKELIAKWQKELQEHKGEFFLVVCRTWAKEQLLFAGPPDLREIIYLGVSQSPYLERTDGDPEDLIFHGQKFMTGHIKLGMFGPDINSTDSAYEGQVGANSKDVGRRLLRIDRESSGCFPSGVGNQEFGSVLEVVVGDQSVKKWFNAASRSLRFRSAHVKDQWHRRDDEQDERVNEMFIKMQAALGRNLGTQEEIEARAKEELLKKKMQIIGELQSLMTKEANLLSSIGDIKKQKPPRLGDGIVFADIDEATAEDFEEAKRWKVGFKNKEYREILGQIERTLGEAFKLKMHVGHWVIVEEPEPGRKTELDVPYWIKNICEKYEIKIPKTSSR